MDGTACELAKETVIECKALARLRKRAGSS